MIPVMSSLQRSLQPAVPVLWGSLQATIMLMVTMIEHAATLRIQLPHILYIGAVMESSNSGNSCVDGIVKDT